MENKVMQEEKARNICELDIRLTQLEQRLANLLAEKAATESLIEKTRSQITTVESQLQEACNEPFKSIA